MSSDNQSETPKLNVLCRSLNQVKWVLSERPDSMIADFADIRQYSDAVQLARTANVPLAIATPRIQKPLEMGVFRAMLKQKPDAVLVRNLAAVEFFGGAGVQTIADYSLNVANEITANFVHELGPTRITPSYDLNRDQLVSLLDAMPAAWLEVVIHQHMPMFHMEHCVFCAVLSPGTNKTNCGRPCDHHVVHLQDRVGMKHRLTADVGCRNTLYNSQAQSAAELVPLMLSRGVRWFRLELLEENSLDAIHQIVELYRDLLAGRIAGREVWARLQADNRVGVTRGTLEAKRDPLAIL